MAQTASITSKNYRQYFLERITLSQEQFLQTKHEILLAYTFCNPTQLPNSLFYPHPFQYEPIIYLLLSL